VWATLNGVPGRVRDIGFAEDGTKEQRSAARLNGVPTVIMEVRRQSGENTVAVIEGVKAKLARLREQVPPDVRLEVIRDQSRYIYAALHEINLHLVLGSILASLVVLAFMRSWRSWPRPSRWSSSSCRSRSCPRSRDGSSTSSG